MSPDVIIAGGGIAGASLAVLLGRAGLHVELFEQRCFPGEKPCGEGLMPAGVGVLERLGLVEAVGGTPFHGVRYHVGAAIAEGRFPHAPGIPTFGLGQRRLRLDQTLFEAARATPGVRVFAGVRVEAPTVERGRVTGVVAAGITRRARLVVIADGSGSRLRRALGLDGPPPRRSRLGVRAHFRLHDQREPSAWVEVFLGDGHELYVTPLPEGEVLVAGLSEKRATGTDVKGAFLRWIAAQPVLRERLARSSQISAIEGRAPLAGRARAGIVSGAVLLGDAAGWTDPVTGGGMAQALLAAELLAEYVPRAVEEGDASLRRFDRRRRRLLRDHRLFTALFLELVRRPWLMRPAVHALRACPPLFSQLMGIAGGARPLFGAARASR
jgi:flavin-dependent dehydrogenase